MFTLIGYDFSDEIIIGYLQTLHSHGGNGDGHTKFNAFFEKCSFILQINGFTKERWHTDGDNILYGSVVTSIPELIKINTGSTQ